MSSPPRSESQPVVELDRVSIRFKLSWERTRTVSDAAAKLVRRLRGSPTRYHEALKKVSMRAYKGDIIGIIGPNGSGKSTLLRAVSGIYAPDQGRVTSRGAISSLLALGTGFDNSLSGIENIYLNAMLVGMDPARIKTKLHEIVEFAEIGEHVSKPLKYYSNGMISRLGFAIVLAMDPDIFLVDEIFSVGDLAFQKKSERAMHELLEKTSCQLIVTHDLNLVREHCNRAVYLHGGSIRLDGDPDEVVKEYQREFG